MARSFVFTIFKFPADFADGAEFFQRYLRNLREALSGRRYFFLKDPALKTATTCDRLSLFKLKNYFSQC
jgi:hypothetical protein